MVFWFKEKLCRLNTCGQSATKQGFFCKKSTLFSIVAEKTQQLLRQAFDYNKLSNRIMGLQSGPNVFWFAESGI